jgi:hypothetical protein
VRAALLTVLLCLGALGMLSTRWAALWLVVPAVVAAGLLLTWRYGRGGLVFPVVLGVAAVAARALLGEGVFPLWIAGWVPLAAVTGAWMGLHEEGGGPGAGDRAWMLLPLLILAAALPLIPGFTAFVVKFEIVQIKEMQVFLQSADTPAQSKEFFKQILALPVADRQEAFRSSIPLAMFFWMAMLVAAGRSFAARIATLLRWPPLSRATFAAYRLPDGALVPLLAGLALAVLAGSSWVSTAWVLLMVASLGYILQGVAVVGALLVARGVPPVFAALTLLFVMVVSLLWVLPAIAVVGLSDVWLDHRRLEPSPEGEA